MRRFRLACGCRIRAYVRGQRANRHQIFGHPAARTSVKLQRELFRPRSWRRCRTRAPSRSRSMHNTQLGDAVANVQSIRNGTIGFTTVSASNLNQVVPAMDMYSLPFLFKNEAHFWWFLSTAAGGRDRQAARGQGHQDHRLHRLRRAQFLHPEGGPHPGRPQGREDPRDGLAGDGQHDEGAGRDRRAGCLGRALHRAADRRGRRRREQSSLRRRQEVLRGVEVLHPRRAHAHSGHDHHVDEAVELSSTTTRRRRCSKPGSARRPTCAARGTSPRSRISRSSRASSPRSSTPDKAPFVKAVSGLVQEEGKRLGVEKTIAFILDSQKNF